MYHYVYKIKNIITNEYYIGVRSCKCNIIEDNYMGSSSIWTKAYIKQNKDILQKEILKEFNSRKDARDYEVFLLKENKDNNLCVNVCFNYVPDHTGKHQNKEWIEKRKLVGNKNGMYGKHHSEKTKRNISNKLKGRIISEEARIKIGAFNKNKKYSIKTRDKISKAHSKLYYIKDLDTNEEWIITLNNFIKLRSTENLKRNTLNTAARFGYICNKHYLIKYYADTNNNTSVKLDNHGETQLDNPVVSNTTVTTSVSNSQDQEIVQSEQ